MASRTIQINTCDRCGHEQDMSTYMSGNEWGKADLSFSWEYGGRAYDGSAGGVSGKEKMWLCLQCTQAFREFLEAKEANKVSDAMAVAADEIELLRDELDMRIGIESQLQALKTRIDAAPVLELPSRETLRSEGPHVVLHTAWAEKVGLAGKRVRLLVEE